MSISRGGQIPSNSGSCLLARDYGNTKNNFFWLFLYEKSQFNLIFRIFFNYLSCIHTFTPEKLGLGYWVLPIIPNLFISDYLHLNWSSLIIIFIIAYEFRICGRKCTYDFPYILFYVFYIKGLKIWCINIFNFVLFRSKDDLKLHLDFF